MFTLNTRNVHEVYPDALNLVFEHCYQTESRNGPVFVAPMPVATVYSRPWERVAFWEERDANPFLHFVEALGFLGGVADVEFYARYAKNMRNYSDDGATLPSSYGIRWRRHFGQDQLAWAVRRLRANPDDRRVVLSMWDGHTDPALADSGGKDVPCNTQVYVQIFEGKLNITVTNRSNDIFFGAYGANAVHMGFLHEYLARHVGVTQGWMIQFSNNWHAYVDVWNKILNERKASRKEHSLRHNAALPLSHRWQPYAELATGGLQTFPLTKYEGAPAELWDEQLAIFLAGGSDQADGLTDPFFLTVAVPIRASHNAYRLKNYDEALQHADRCAAQDWRRGCREWLERRARDRAAKAASAESGPAA